MNEKMTDPIAFVNSDGNGQVVVNDPCPACGYPERHRIYRFDGMVLIADGCPSCETSRMKKPWENAKPGEHWELTVHGTVREYVVILSYGNRGECNRFFPISDVKAVVLGIEATVITAGRRIWPEAS